MAAQLLLLNCERLCRENRARTGCELDLYPVRQAARRLILVRALRCLAKRLEPEAPATLLGGMILKRDHAQARALQRELFELIKRYEAHSGSQGYILYSVPTPV